MKVLRFLAIVYRGRSRSSRERRWTLRRTLSRLENNEDGVVVAHVRDRLQMLAATHCRLCHIRAACHEGRRAEDVVNPRIEA